MDDHGPSITYYQMNTARLTRLYSKANKQAEEHDHRNGRIGNHWRRIAEDMAMVLRQRGVLPTTIRGSHAP